jgi:hypothetical protein
MQPSGYDKPILEGAMGEPIAHFMIPDPLTLAPLPFTPNTLVEPFPRS